MTSPPVVRSEDEARAALVELEIYHETHPRQHGGLMQISQDELNDLKENSANLMQSGSKRKVFSF
jgi:hypothetical protein